jgi:hypothetical protein
MRVTSGTLKTMLKNETLSSQRPMKPKASKKPPKSVPVSRPSASKREAKVFALPAPPEAEKKQPGLITQFINMVDIAEAISEAEKKKE